MGGYIHSIETMGLVDGPGIRTVVFLAGCSMRCVYCHNPDTWTFGGEWIEADALMEKLLRYKPYYEKSGGGVTFSGGEPLLQPKFLLEMLKKCKEKGIHTCIDTSGYGHGDYTEILKHVDLILYDVKHCDPLLYQEITKKPIDRAEAFLKAAQEAGKALWLRHVVIPGFTDSPMHMRQLQEYIAKIEHVEKVELLPYHTMGVEKYKKLGIPYPLDGIPPMGADKTKEYQNLFFGAKNT